MSQHKKSLHYQNIKVLDIDSINDRIGYEKVRNDNFVGFASLYLQKSKRDATSINTADESMYKQLVDIDSKMGTTKSEQLFWCLAKTTRLDLIKVSTFVSRKCSKEI